MTTKILTLGIDNDDIENLDIGDDKVLLKTKTLRELESMLDEGEEVDTILVDSHFLTSPRRGTTKHPWFDIAHDQNCSTILRRR